VSVLFGEIQSWHTVAARVAVVVVGLALWFLTQWLISRRPARVMGANDGAIGDGIHHITARIHRHFVNNPRQANALLIVSSLVIDVLGLFLIASALFGPSIEPFLGLIMVFALRQICQAFCPLPPPQEMIWRKPGFPALLVTYGVSNDLFFSGHTAIAVFGAAYLATHFGPVGMAAGIAIAVFEISTVLVLRAHYTMDVFAGAVAALYVHRLAADWSPGVDRWIAGVLAHLHG
jgi:hypothetical protein